MCIHPSRTVGSGVQCVCPHPLVHGKGPLNLRRMVKMALRMQETTLIFENFPGKCTPFVSLFILSFLHSFVSSFFGLFIGSFVCLFVLSLVCWFAY